MNEQIREFALKSGIAYLSEHTAYLTGNDGLTVLPSVSSLEKFAELIVNECLGICEELGNKGMDGHYCADKILEHFGVDQ